MSRRNTNNKKKSNRISFIGAVMKILLLIVNIVVAAALLAAYISQVLPPSVWLLVSYCGLAFPYLLIANLVFVLLWLPIDYKYSLVSLLVILLNINNIDRCFQLRATPRPEVCASCVKVMSYNARLYGIYDSENAFERNQKKDKIFDLLRQERPEILCIQEHFVDKSGKLHFTTTDSIMSILHFDDYKRHCYEYFIAHNQSHDYHYGMAIFSRYRILNCDYIDMGDSSNNVSIYVDIKFKNDTVRIYNVHLTSIGMNADDYAMGRDISSNGMDDPHLDKKAKRLYDKVGKAFIKRQYQAKILRAHIDSCPHSVIICGDFNDSPVSYAYHKVGHGFKDAFRESGGGKGQTYCGDAFPSFRIDYIFHNKDFKSFGYTTFDSLKVSDHYPIMTNISLLK